MHSLFLFSLAEGVLWVQAVLAAVSFDAQIARAAASARGANAAGLDRGLLPPARAFCRCDRAVPARVSCAATGPEFLLRRARARRCT